MNLKLLALFDILAVLNYTAYAPPHATNDPNPKPPKSQMIASIRTPVLDKQGNPAKSMLGQTMYTKYKPGAAMSAEQFLDLERSTKSSKRRGCHTMVGRIDNAKEILYLIITEGVVAPSVNHPLDIFSMTERMLAKMQEMGQTLCPANKLSDKGAGYLVPGNWEPTSPQLPGTACLIPCAYKKRWNDIVSSADDVWVVQEKGRTIYYYVEYVPLSELPPSENLAQKASFTEGRLKVLEGIISNGGSVQSYDVFTYDEYKRIDKLDQKIAEPFKYYADSLKAHIKKLVSIHPELTNAITLDEIYTELESELVCRRESECVSLALDDLTNRLLLREHMENKPKGVDVNPAVIEGAGPIGQFAAIRLFVAGFDIRLFNDRSEDYLRNQIVLLDTKWTVQLRFYLGTIFDELFKDDAKGRLFEESGFQSQAGVGANEFKVIN
ncbi:hypothetical protein DdX_18164 [Ditylenchus destructor]|uniref:Uncharacterized protein n=1 Tax=Ditylenchus destructor TaxID=166010 RepID=A0AAD4QYE7_9BILA|nr:hypothetical protein DdX_18164 [Ditylenchus destructor]